MASERPWMTFMPSIVTIEGSMMVHGRPFATLGTLY